MNRREELTAAILVALNEWDAPVNDAVIHAAVSSRLSPEPSKGEFDEVMGIAARAGWVDVARSTKGARWFLTDAGLREVRR